jgi:hypothetical protein
VLLGDILCQVERKAVRVVQPESIIAGDEPAFANVLPGEDFVKQFQPGVQCPQEIIRINLKILRNIMKN